MKNAPLQSLCLAVALFTLAATQRAHAIAYQLDGLVDKVNGWHGVYVGSTFSAFLTFDVTMASAQNGMGLYPVPTTMRVEVDGVWRFDYTGLAPISTLDVGADTFRFESFIMKGTSSFGNTWNYFSVGLEGTTGRFGAGIWSGILDDPHWSGQITQVTTVPDAGSSAMLIGMALAPMLFAHGFRRAFVRWAALIER